MTPAYEHNGRPCTREAFYAIACDPRRHVAVEACAGAGKTWMLVSRMLRALLDGSAPHEILAITFTKKAAGEMRQRLREWLQDFARPRPARPDQGQPAETEADWLARLDKELVSRGIEPKSATSQRQQLQNLYASVLGHGRPVQIRTFHSWFIALLKCAPLAVLRQLGLPSAFELLEDDADAVAEVWRRYLRTLAGDAGLSADYHALVAQLGRHTAHQALEAALARRVEFQLADAAGHVEEAVAAAGAMVPELAAFAHPADALLTDAARTRWQAWARELGAEKNKTPQNAAAAVIDAFEAPADGPQRLAALRKAFFVADEDRLSKNLQKFPAAQEAEAELQRLLPATRQHDARAHHQRLARLARVLIDSFAQLKRERGWVDMPDVERAALTLLADHELSAWVQQRLDARTRHLLIDEFQDTNPLQWQALHAWLAGYAGAGGGAQAAPSVFIVGDPKQSIYRFRRADPQVFAAARQFIATGLGGE
ncbi:MAG TPA: UvrD-helicase domain-containing protein, partial [Ottowia sp.]|nr:UvrD-helicase domain-containing protein [Ottowia sp.]